MLGVYDYTVVLTYLSLISAASGIIVSLSDGGHPYLGIMFLLLCGLFDAFDGKVAHTKKNRTEFEKKFGIQIDSLSDLVAFGVLPATIGVACLRVSPWLRSLELFDQGKWNSWAVKLIFYGILVLYTLAALIRLAYFNVTEEERQAKEGGIRKVYTGLPVTSASLIFPFIMILNYILPVDISILYIPVAAVTAFCFLGKFTIPKLHLKGILVLIGIGVLEFVCLIVTHIFFR